MAWLVGARPERGASKQAQMDSSVGARWHGRGERRPRELADILPIAYSNVGPRGSLGGLQRRATRTQCACDGRAGGKRERTLDLFLDVASVWRDARSQCAVRDTARGWSHPVRVRIAYGRCLLRIAPGQRQYLATHGHAWRLGLYLVQHPGGRTDAATVSAIPVRHLVRAELTPGATIFMTRSSVGDDGRRGRLTIMNAVIPQP